jgi:ABC-2 type transport system permease protein
MSLAAVHGAPGADSLAPGGSVLGVAQELARRSLVNIARTPSAVVPTIAMPLFFIVAFSGAFGALTDIPGFPTDNAINWFMPWAIMQGAAFAGMGVCFGIGRDLENGFYDRLLMAPTHRLSLVIGPLMAAVLRVLLPVVTVSIVGFAAGARLTDGLVGMVTLVVAAEGFALVAALWGLGVVFRLRTQRSGALIQVGIFVTMFLSIGQAPIELMEGWLPHVARVNPLTYVIDMGRAGFLGPVTWSAVWPGLVAIAVGLAVFSVWTLTGFRRLVR